MTRIQWNVFWKMLIYEITLFCLFRTEHIFEEFCIFKHSPRILELAEILEFTETNAFILEIRELGGQVTNTG